MDSILASSHSPPLFLNQIRSASLASSSRTRRFRVQRPSASKSLKFQSRPRLRGRSFVAFCSLLPETSPRIEPEGNSLKCIAKQVAMALLCVAVGLAPMRTLRGCAIAAPAVAEASERKEREKEGSSYRGHESSDCTRKLLETTSLLLRSLDEARGGSGGEKQVAAAMAAVKVKKAEMQKEVMDRLYAELSEMKEDKKKLKARLEEIMAEAESLGKETGSESEREDRLGRLQEEHNWIMERIGEIDDRIMRRETSTFSFGVRELNFIERECEQLVQGFKKEMRRKGMDRYEIL